MRTDFADPVSVFLDQAAAAGVSHVTYLTAYGTDSAPPETAMRRVELDLGGRPGVNHAILRPACVLSAHTQNWWICVERAIEAESAPRRAKSA